MQIRNRCVLDVGDKNAILAKAGRKRTGVKKKPRHAKRPTFYNRKTETNAYLRQSHSICKQHVHIPCYETLRSTGVAPRTRFSSSAPSQARNILAPEAEPSSIRTEEYTHNENTVQSTCVHYVNKRYSSFALLEFAFE